jgi:hypothetical protein
VTVLIDAGTREFTQHRAFHRLEALGSRAVLSIIVLKDGWRELVVPAISLYNRSGG